jgi:hypothetical protein
MSFSDDISNNFLDMTLIFLNIFNYHSFFASLAIYWFSSPLGIIIIIIIAMIGDLLFVFILYMGFCVVD